jgi:hypothetical protein
VLIGGDADATWLLIGEDADAMKGCSSAGTPRRKVGNHPTPGDGIGD